MSITDKRLIIFRTCLLLVFFLYLQFGFCNPAFSRQGKNISGEVKDTSGQPVELASIIFRKLPSLSLMAFTNAEVSGKFSVLVETNLNYQVEIRRIGFETLKDTVFITQNSKQLTFMLKEGTEALGELVITGEKPVAISKGDTLEFSATDFRTKGDLKAVDLFKKIPGLDIRQDGGIFYKGERIEDITIEGESIFSKNPETLSQSFPADAIDKVQILENYSDFGERSDQFNKKKAINITLSDDKKNIIFGDAIASGGLNSSTAYQFKTDVFLVKKKLKLMVISDFNNVGKRTFNFRSYINFIGGIGEAGNLKVQGNLFSEGPTETPPETESQFGALSLVYSPSEKMKVRSYLLLNREHFEKFSISERFYGSNQINTPFQETSNIGGEQLVFSSKTTFIAVPNSKNTFVASLKLAPSVFSNDSRGDFKFGSLQTNTKENTKSKNHKNSLQLTHLHTFSKSKTFDTKISVDYKPSSNSLALENSLDVFSALIPSSENDSLSFFEVRQRTKDEEWQGNASVNYTNQVGSAFEWKMEIGNEFRKISRSFTFNTYEQVPPDLNSASNYTLNELYLSPKIAYIKGMFRIQLDGNLSNFQLFFEGINNREAETKILFMPKATLKIQLPFSQSLRFKYEKKNDFADENQLNETFSIKSAQLIEKGNSGLGVVPTHSFQFDYSYTNLYSRIFAFLLVSHESTNQGFSTKQQIGLASLTTPIQTPSSNTLIFGYLSKSLNGKIPLTAKAKFNISVLNSSLFLQNDFVGFKNVNRQINLNILSNSKKKLNAELEISSRQSDYIPENGVKSRNSTSSIVGKILWRSTEKLTLKPSLEQILFTSQGNSDRQFTFANFSARYQLNKKLSVEVESYNMTNTDEIVTGQVTPAYESQTRRAVLQRFFLVGLGYKF